MTVPTPKPVQNAFYAKYAKIIYGGVGAALPHPARCRCSGVLILARHIGMSNSLKKCCSGRTALFSRSCSLYL